VLELDQVAKDSCVVCAGASRGIGKETAFLLAQ
jgi:NADP-dependent 3-hydroxy acid dehydrogenase YdfG